MHAVTQPITLDESLLAGWPLPPAGEDADKEVRGRAVVLAGSREMPGAAILAGTAVLHAGAGKLVIGTAASVAGVVAAAVPEARVIGLPETPEGGFALGAAALVGEVLEGASALLLGPGMSDAEGSLALLCHVLRECAAPAVLDAIAMDAMLVRRPDSAAPRILATPHAGEMAHLLGIAKAEVVSDPVRTARSACARWNAVVAAKGASTAIAAPDGRLWWYEGNDPGLATCGSGDVLAGIMAGLVSRGASLEQAAAWGVALHALAGRRLAAKVGPLGYLARDLSSQVPGLMWRIASGKGEQP